MKFMFVYRGGVVPEDQLEQNMKELWAWLDDLREKGYEKVRFAGSGRKVVAHDSVADYSGDVFGASIIEVDSLDEAISLTSNWPELTYGGQIEVFEALGD